MLIVYREGVSRMSVESVDNESREGVDSSVSRGCVAVARLPVL